MSLIIEDTDVYLRSSYPSAFIDKKLQKQNESLRITDEEVTKMCKYRLQTDQSPKFKVTSTKKKIFISAWLHQVYRQLSFLLNITIDKNTATSSAQYKLVSSNSTYLIIPSQRNRLLAERNIVKIGIISSRIFSNFKIAICPSTGLIRISIVMNCNIKKYIDRPNKIVDYYKYELTYHLKQHHRYIYIDQIVKLAYPVPQSFSDVLIADRKNDLIRRIQKFSHFMHIIPNCQSPNSSAEILKKKTVDEINTVKKRQQDYVELDTDLKSIGNYLNQNYSFNNQYLLSNLSQRQKLQIKENLKNDKKDGWMIDHIILKNQYINSDKLKLIARGGYSNIYHGAIQFKLVDSHKVANLTVQEFDSLNKGEFKKQNLLVKRQMRNNNRRSRVKHEIQILKQLKNVSPIYFPKYYLVANPPQQTDYYDLIQDPILSFGQPFTLKQFLDKFHMTISLRTRFQFAIGLINALRRLQQYEIAHLDIKPSNIMVHTRSRNQVKIIDFGQSFHKSIIDSEKLNQLRFKPAITMPYSAPQNYEAQYSFDYKSDVFSFGVILYMLMNNKLPFSFTYEKEQIALFKNKQILNRWLFAPETLECQGQSVIMMILPILISKCLDPDPKRRPELQWLTLILKYSSEFIENSFSNYH